MKAFEHFENWLTKQERDLDVGRNVQAFVDATDALVEATLAWIRFRVDGLDSVSGVVAERFENWTERLTKLWKKTENVRYQRLADYAAAFATVALELQCDKKAKLSTSFEH